MNWYLKVMSSYFNVTGRARRKEYWMFFLFYLIALFAAVLLDSLLGTAFLSAVVVLVHLVPAITVGVRRLHDINRSGWWLLINFVPLIGGLVVLYWGTKAGDSGSNNFGEDPKAAV